MLSSLNLFVLKGFLKHLRKRRNLSTDTWKVIDMDDKIISLDTKKIEFFSKWCCWSHDSLKI